VSRPAGERHALERLTGLGATALDVEHEGSLTASIDTDRTSTGRRKIAAFDGLRGIACVLVLLGHSWIIVPTDVIDSTGAVRGLFFSQNLAVITFFVLGGFLVAHSLLEQQQRIGTIPVGRFWVRRLVRIGAQLVPFATVILIVSIFDRWDQFTGDQTRRSLVNILRFTFNWSLVNDPLGNRDDLGHLWYLSVEQQVYVVVVVLLIWLARYRTALIVTLCAAALAVMVYRWIVFDRDGWYVASLRTMTRADGLLLGCAAALAFPLFRRVSGVARAATLPALVLFAFLVLLSAPLSNVAFLQTQGIVFVLAATVLVLAIAVSARPDGLAERFLSWTPFRFVGLVSFPVYLWHYPAFWAADRWAKDMQWLPRALITLLALAAIVAITQVAIERPVGRWLDRNRHGGDVEPAAPDVVPA
jgi:peptidoglycan/LPS O-acetylase OafA/YrhL